MLNILFLFSVLIYIKNRYRELIHVSRQWRDLQRRKQFGLGHDEDMLLENGSLALFCPACPQPGINLPTNWQDDSLRCVITKYLMVFTNIVVIQVAL
jgi:hypothetical protein